MSKSVKLLFGGVGFSVLCGVIFGLVRSSVLSAKPYPLFYFIFLASAALIAVLSYFIAALSKSEGREGLCLYNGISDATKCAESYNDAIILISLFGSALLIISAIRAAVFGIGGKLSAINIILLFACSFTLILRALNKEQSIKTGIMSLIPIFYLSVYMLLFYQDNARFPDTSSFAPQAITVAALVFSVYFNAASKFDPRIPMLRYASALISLSLCVGEGISFLALRSSLKSADPAFFLLMIFGFSIYYTSSLFVPPLRLYKINRKKTENISES